MHGGLCSRVSQYAHVGTHTRTHNGKAKGRCYSLQFSLGLHVACRCLACRANHFAAFFGGIPLVECSRARCIAVVPCVVQRKPNCVVHGTGVLKPSRIASCLSCVSHNCYVLHYVHYNAMYMINVTTQCSNSNRRKSNHSGARVTATTTIRSVVAFVADQFKDPNLLVTFSGKGLGFPFLMPMATRSKTVHM